jgi:predicted chitinase
MKNAMIKYQITTKERVAAFLSQVNAETNYLIYSSELASGEAYEGRKDLGNTNPGDGRKFKGRGLIQLTGRSNYKSAGEYFNKDFISDTTVVAADNATHKKGAATPEQIENTILTSVRYWLLGSTKGNLNDYADKMDIRKGFDFGGTSLENLPESNKQGKQYGNGKSKNYATAFNANDANFVNLTIICLGVNGGYNGYRERFKNWLRIRELLT